MDRHKSLNRRSGAVANRGCAALALLWACASCRTLDQTQVELLESELRRQETYIYELEDYLLEYSEKLNQCRRNHAAERGLNCNPDLAETHRASKSADSIPEPELADDPPRPSKGAQSGAPPEPQSRRAKSNGAPPAATPRKPSVESDPSPLLPSRGANSEPARKVAPPSATPVEGDATPTPEESDQFENSVFPDASEGLPDPANAAPSTGSDSASELDSPFPSADEPASSDGAPSPERPATPENQSPETFEAEPLEIGWRHDDQQVAAESARIASASDAQPNATRRRPMQARLQIPDAANYVDDETQIDRDVDGGPTQAPLVDADKANANSVTVAVLHEEVDPAVVGTSADGAEIADAPMTDAPTSDPRPTDAAPTYTATTGAPIADAETVDAARIPRSIDICRIIIGDPHATEEPALLVVVETLNSRQEPLEPDGQVSLMAMIKDAPGSWTRIRRWDFTSDEAASSWQSTALGDGFHLQLPLAQDGLPEKPLELWARVVFKDGSKILTKRPLDMRSLQSLDDALASASLPTSPPTAPERPIPSPAEQTPSAPVARSADSSATPRVIPRAPSPCTPVERVPVERVPVELAPAQLTTIDSQESPATGSSANSAPPAPLSPSDDWRPATRPITSRRNAASDRSNGARQEKSPAWSVRTEPIPQRRPASDSSSRPPLSRPRVGAPPAPRWQPYR